MNLYQENHKADKMEKRSLRFVLLLGGSVFCMICALLFVYSPVIGAAFLVALALGVVTFLKVEVGVWGILISIGLGSLGQLSPGSPITAFKIVTFLVFCICVFRIGLLKDSALLRLIRLPIILWLVAFLFLNVFSLTYTSSIYYSILYLIRLVAFFAFYLIFIISIRTYPQLKRIVIVLLAITLFISFLGVYEIASKRSILALAGREAYLTSGTESGLLVTTDVEMLTTTEESEWSRIRTTFVDPNYYGSYIVIILCISLAMCFYTRRLWKRLVLIFLISLLLINLVATGSRAAFIELIVATFVLFVFLEFPYKKLIGFSAMAILIILIPLLPELFPQYRGGFSREGVEGDPRIGTWRTAFQVLKAHPVFGIGLGNFLLQYNHYRHPTARVNPLLPHNFLLQAWVETGILSLLTLIAYFGSLIWGLFSTVLSCEDRFSRHLAIALLAACCGYMFFALTSNVFENDTFWLLNSLMAVVIVINRFYNKEGWAFGFAHR